MTSETDTLPQVHGDELANPPGCYGTRFCRGFDATHIAANQYGDIAVEQILFSDKHHIGRLAHRVRSFYCPDPTSRFDHPERLVHDHPFIGPGVKVTKYYP